MIRARLCVIFAALLLFSACASDEELLGGLDVQRAVEIVIALKNSGIASEMERTKSGREEQYSITVSRAQRDMAIRVLKEYNLLERHQETFDSLTSGDSFVPNARETAELRLDRALGVEIERALSAIDGIVDVRAIIRSQLVQNDDRAQGERSAPSASVLIRFVSKSGNPPFSLDDIRALIAKAVPGLPAESITLTTTRVYLGEDGAGESPAGVDPKGRVVPLARVNPFPFLVPASDEARVRNILSALLAAFALAGLIIGWLFSRTKRPPALPGKAVRTAMIEATFKGPSDSTTPVPAKRAAPPKGGGVSNG